MKFCKEFLKNNGFKNDCSKFIRSKRSASKLSCCYVVCEMEKTICPQPRLKFILNLIKSLHVPRKPKRVISATRGWEYFAEDYL